MPMMAYIKRVTKMMRAMLEVWGKTVMRELRSFLAKGI